MHSRIPRRWRTGVLAGHAVTVAGFLAVSVAGAAAGDAGNVPDVVARQSGLRLAPMPRAARLYAENCQGCHGAAGRSVQEIPALAGRAGYFARSAEGRRYLVQVPNVALNPNSDADIAALMNWMLNAFSADELPPSFTPYSADEVAAARGERIDVAATRRRVVAQLLAGGQLPAPDALAVAPSVLY